MFVAEPEFPIAHRLDAEGDDQNLAGRKDGIAPAIQQRPDLDLDPQLFLQFALEARNRIFTILQPPTGQFPLVTLVLQENDLPSDQAHTLDRHRP